MVLFIGHDYSNSKLDIFVDDGGFTDNDKYNIRCKKIIFKNLN